MKPSLRRNFAFVLLCVFVLAASVPALQTAFGSSWMAGWGDPLYLPLVLDDNLSPPMDTPTDTLTLTVTPTGTSTFTLTPTATLTDTPTPAVTPTDTVIPTATPAAPGHIVISEFRTIGPLGADDEFVELYNPTGVSVNIGDWVIKKSSGCGSSTSTLVTIYYGTTLMPGQHYLAAAYASSSSIANADQRFSPGIADPGGLALVSPGGTVIDQVGMCATTYYHEGRPLPPLPVAPLAGTPTPQPGTSNQSYERKPGGNTACYDTSDNVNDFNLISPASPLSQANSSVLCAGVVLASPTPSPTSTDTLTPTATPTPPCPVMPELKLSVTQSPLTIYPPIMIYTAELDCAPTTSSAVLKVDFYNLSGNKLEYLGSAPIDQTGKAVLSKSRYPGTYTAIARVVINTREIWSNPVMYTVL